MVEYKEPMCGFKDAIAWAERQPDSTLKGCAIRRMKYEMSKAEPIKPKFHQGKYNKRYDSYTCENCGFVLEVGYSYCPNCGKAIDWKDKWKEVTE